VREIAAIDVVTLGIRRLCRDDKDGRVKLRRSFVSRDRRTVLAVGIGELPTSAVMMVECLFGELLADDFALRSKLAMIAGAVIRQLLSCQWDA
jgi:hypothetical protein